MASGGFDSLQILSLAAEAVETDAFRAALQESARHEGQRSRRERKINSKYTDAFVDQDRVKTSHGTLKNQDVGRGGQSSQARANSDKYKVALQVLSCEHVES